MRDVYLIPSDSGMEMMTPFPVPTHSRLQDTTRAVILTKENPSLPVPATHTGQTDHTGISPGLIKLLSCTMVNYGTNY